MKFLKRFEMKEDTWIDLAVKCRKNSVFQFRVLSGALKVSYGVYRETITDNAKCFCVSSFSSNKELLVDYYTSPPVSLREIIRARRNDHALEECPYCGHPFPPDTLDHFIPKEHWPEYSIYSNNLVPQCKYCAPIKGTQYLCTKEGKPIFIHPIFSDLLSKIKFKVTIQLSGGEPSFGCKFASTEKLAQEERAAVLRHLKRLSVKGRFEGYCRNRYRFWRNKVMTRGIDIRAAFRQRVSEMPCEGDFSSNWSRAFLVGALSCHPFIESLERLAPGSRCQRDSRFADEPLYPVDL